MSVKLDTITDAKVRYFYDLEVLPYNFTNAFVDMSNKIVVVMLLNGRDDHDYDYDFIHEKLQNAYPDFTVRPILDLDDRKTVENFHKYFSNYYTNAEWFGWNSKTYDLMLMATILSFYELNMRMPSTNKIRQWSDSIIVEGNKFAKRFFDAIKQHDSFNLGDVANKKYKTMLASQKHVDVGALNEKSGDDASKNEFVFPLKVMQSYVGLDVIDDDIVKDNELNRILTQDELVQLLIYNINDVVATGRIFEEPEYIGQLSAKDTLRQECDFLTKRPKEYGFMYQLPRDATSTQYAGRIVRGANMQKLKDKEKVILEFPFKDGRMHNVLDHMEKYEKNINPRIIEFYRHVENKDTREKDDYDFVKDSTLTGKTTINTPYFDKDGNATSAYITASWGGAHGGIVKNSTGRRLDRKSDEKWFREFESTDFKNIVATVDVKSIIHVDFASYYPTMNIALGVYKPKDGGVDNYEVVRTKRYALKDMLTPELEVQNSEEYESTDRRQDSFKLVLNGATGGSNQHKEHVDLPLDNATLSMRIMGNLFIYILGQRFANEGGLIISTNTDGLYVANIDMEAAERVVQEYFEVYGLELKPEVVDRMINKSANERIEMKNDKIKTVGGALKRSMKNRIDLSSKINYPRVSGKAVLNYIEQDETWLLNPINKKRLRELIELQLDDFQPIDWTVTLKGNRDRKYYLEDDNITDLDIDGFKFKENAQRLQNTNRIILSKEGQRIIQYFKDKPAKITGLTSNRVRILNWEKELKDVDSYKHDLDIDAYVEWAYAMLDTWHNPAPISELDGERPEIQEQASIFDDLYM